MNEARRKILDYLTGERTSVRATIRFYEAQLMTLRASEADLTGFIRELEPGESGGHQERNQYTHSTYDEQLRPAGVAKVCSCPNPGPCLTREDGLCRQEVQAQAKDPTGENPTCEAVIQADGSRLCVLCGMAWSGNAVAMGFTRCVRA